MTNKFSIKLEECMYVLFLCIAASSIKKVLREILGHNTFDILEIYW